MPLYNFQPQFVAKILSGEKRHTIRAKRKRPTKAGERLYLYTGLRQKGARKLLDAVCTKVQDISIVRIKRVGVVIVTIDGIDLHSSEREELARRDGFDSWGWMLKFWEDRLPFHGDIIHWKPLKEVR